MPIRKGTEALAEDAHRLRAGTQFVQGLQFIQGERYRHLPSVGGRRQLPGVSLVAASFLQSPNKGSEEPLKLLRVDEKREAPKLDLNPPATLTPEDTAVPSVVQVGPMKAAVQGEGAMHGTVYLLGG